MFDFLKKKKADSLINNALDEMGSSEPQEQTPPSFPTQEEPHPFPEVNKFAPESIQHFKEEPEMSQPVNKEIHNSAMHNANTEYLKKSLEVLNTKLDTIRVSLENINQRLVNLERIAVEEEKRLRERW